MNNLAFRLYIIFIVSYFLHLTARFPALGVIRFDLLLVCTITGLILLNRRESTRDGLPETTRILFGLIIYIIVTVPLVEWPGSVLRTNGQIFIKAVIFYYFSVSLISSQERLKLFMTVFLLSQAFRVMEPLYLHWTIGYWGARTHIEYGRFMARLSGSPYDVINPNGLGEVIAIVMGLGYYIVSAGSTRWKIFYFIGLPFLLYGLILTASRMGFLQVVGIAIAILFKTRNKIIGAALVCIALIVIWATLNPLQKDRYLSIGRSDVNFASSAQGRIDGTLTQLKVAFRRPIVGHGLGTSLEANFNVSGEGKVTHNLYVELFQELGIIGLFIFLLFLKSMMGNIRSLKQISRLQGHVDSYLLRVTDGLQIWFLITVIASVASYGLSTYHWYLLGGLSLVVRRLIENDGEQVRRGLSPS